ncbi:odorant receptor 131-2-like [Embiotoca jacksoni]|uniref:odorant receptor 131-2-like n=1 Tax=Embiotoca jacksoni TaxID=100190 RepID=UPI0037048F88
MNFSSYNYNVSDSASYRDSRDSAVAKNVLLVALGLTIGYINGTLIHTFTKHQIFYMNPRYILFIHLVVNDIIQLTMSISLFVLSYVFYKINVSLCCLTVAFTSLATVNTPLNLAVMAVECYIAVCLPLRHVQLCTIKRTYILIGWIWVMSLLSNLPDVLILLVTEPVEIFYSTILCNKESLFRHPIILKKREVTYIVFLIGVWLTLFYTYFRIFFAAKSAAGDVKKARNTILLHGFQLLLSMLTYVYPLCLQALVYWLPRHYLHGVFFFYILIQILPRCVSPIVYGLRDKIFKQYLKKYLLCTMRMETDQRLQLNSRCSTNHKTR